MKAMVYSSHACDGDLAQLVGLTHKHFIFSLKAGGDLQTHRGVLKHDDLIGKPWGSQVFSHMGAPFFLLQPSLADILNDLPRTTQILYPKDIGYIPVSYTHLDVYKRQQFVAISARQRCGSVHWPGRCACDHY